MGFISLLLTALQDPISEICISQSVASTWHPCKSQKESKTETDSTDNRRRLLQFLDAGGSTRRYLAGKSEDKCAENVRTGSEITSCWKVSEQLIL